MKSIKKQLPILIALFLLGAYFLFPNVQKKVNKVIFPVDDVKKAVSIDPSWYDIKLKGVNTKDANLKGFYGKNIVFLNFWGTWCPPCVNEWPSIQKLYELKKNEVDFVLIAVKNDEQEVKEFLDKNNYSVPVYIADSPISPELLPTEFPTTYLLNPDGQILLKEKASKDWSAPDVIEFINNLTPKQ